MLNGTMFLDRCQPDFAVMFYFSNFTVYKMDKYVNLARKNIRTKVTKACNQTLGKNQLQIMI